MVQARVQMSDEKDRGSFGSNRARGDGWSGGARFVFPLFWIVKGFTKVCNQDPSFWKRIQSRVKYDAAVSCNYSPLLQSFNVLPPQRQTPLERLSKQTCLRSTRRNIIFIRVWYRKTKTDCASLWLWYIRQQETESSTPGRYLLGAHIMHSSKTILILRSCFLESLLDASLCLSKFVGPRFMIQPKWHAPERSFGSTRDSLLYRRESTGPAWDSRR